MELEKLVFKQSYLAFLLMLISKRTASVSTMTLYIEEMFFFVVF